MGDSAEKRKVDIAVLSDIHLGTYGCQAKEVVAYLKSIDPEILILNGDIIDIWQFSKSYWPAAHMSVVREILKMITQNKKIYYLAGNHDEMFRKFLGFKILNFKIANKVVLNLDGKKAWFFHGDVFDVTIQHSKWLAKIGGKGYDLLIIINSAVNWISEKMGKEKISISKRIKNGVKGAVKFINRFEQVAADIAIDNGYDYVVCGHIHQPVIREIENNHGKVTYLNSGDWVENSSSLEYNNGEWKLYRFAEDNLKVKDKKEHKKEEKDTKEIMSELLTEFNSMKMAEVVK